MDEPRIVHRKLAGAAGIVVGVLAGIVTVVLAGTAVAHQLAAALRRRSSRRRTCPRC